MVEICKGEFYLVIKRKNWGALSARLTKGQPGLDFNERAVKVSIEVPKALFDTPTITAKVVVPESAVTPPTIQADVLDNVQQLVEQQLGVKLEISVVEPTTVED